VDIGIFQNALAQGIDFMRANAAPARPGPKVKAKSKAKPKPKPKAGK
jgi:hypothetical protein